MENLGIFLLALSIGFFGFGAVYFLRRTQGRKFSQRLLVLTTALMLAILCIEIFSRFYERNTSMMATVFIDTLKTISMDADYEAAVGPIEIFGNNFADMLFRIYRTVIYTVTPVISCALIYDVIAGVSPNLRLFFLSHRKLMIFSQLNKKSVVLAEDISQNLKYLGNPVIVFSGYDREDEGTDAELVSRAKNIGAICIEDDILHCDSFRASGLCSFFLMSQADNQEEEDAENLSILQGLMQKRPDAWNAKRGCNIFFFTNSADTIENIRAIKLDYKRNNGEKKNAEIVLRVVRDYANCCSMLLNKHPIFEACAPKAKGEAVRCLIIGYNSFSKEMFKTLFWCGQMLDHKLELSFVCRESDPSFFCWLNRLNSEILKSCTPGDRSLLISAEGDMAEPYASIYSVASDFENTDVYEFLREKRSYQYGSTESFRFEDYDCFFVMDEDNRLNVSLADELRRALTYLGHESDACVKKTIYTLVENEKLNYTAALRYNTLNERKDSSVRMVVFGNMEERYCCHSIYVDDAYARHDLRCGTKKFDRHSLPSMDETRDDIYNEWSNIARAYHQKYKQFSADCYNTCEETGNYSLLCSAEDKINYCRKIREDRELFRRLTWLEHRRWNAFLRVQGFRTPYGLVDALLKLEEGKGLYQSIDGLIGYAYKNIPDRLHPCLVESAETELERRDLLDLCSDIRTLVDAIKGKTAPCVEKEAGAAFDVGRHIPAQEAPYGLKQYDTPDKEFSPVLSLEELCVFLLGDIDKYSDRQHMLKELKKTYPQIELCRKKDCEDVYYADLVIDYKEHLLQQCNFDKGSERTI